MRPWEYMPAPAASGRGAQKAAEADDEKAWAFWLEVERAVTELLNEAVPPGPTQH